MLVEMLAGILHGELVESVCDYEAWFRKLWMVQKGILNRYNVLIHLLMLSCGRYTVNLVSIVKIDQHHEYLAILGDESRRN